MKSMQEQLIDALSDNRDIRVFFTDDAEPELFETEDWYVGQHALVYYSLTKGVGKIPFATIEKVEVL